MNKAFNGQMDADQRNKNIVNEMMGDGKKRGHGGCGHRQPQFFKTGLKLLADFKRASGEDGGSAGRQSLSVAQVLQVLKRISDEDAHAMGLDPRYARPEWMIMTVMPVPPMTVRPSIQMDAMPSEHEDDLTYKLNDIFESKCSRTKL